MQQSDKSSSEIEKESSSNSGLEKDPIELNYVLYDTIKTDDKFKCTVTEKITNADEVENKICKVCFQEIYYPHADKASNEELKNDSAQKLSDGECKDLWIYYKFLGLYLMIHCKSCYINVHWNCIGTDIEVMRKYKHKKPYYFFECDKCKFKELNKENPGKYKFNFNSGTTVMQ